MFDETVFLKGRLFDFEARSSPLSSTRAGGISVLGTAASAAGGLFVGVSFFVASLLSTQLSSAPWLSWVLPLGVAAGVIGSTIDSLLGATIQFRHAVDRIPTLTLF